MLQSAKDLEFVHSDVFNFKPSASRFDLILCLGLIAHTGRLDTLLPHLRSMLASGGQIILQTTLADHFGTRVVRALTSRSELARRGYRISWFSQRNISADCDWLRRVDLYECVRGPGCHSWRRGNRWCTSGCDEGRKTSEHRRRKPGARKQEARQHSMSARSDARLVYMPSTKIMFVLAVR